MDFIKKNLGFIVVLILGIIPLYSLLHPGLPLTHDGQDHVARIANFYQSLSEGNLVPRWAANLDWGYGHPILMFLYPFSSYTASFFHLLGFSFVDSLKIIFGLGFVLSGVFMYLWIRNMLGEKEAIFASILYMFAPYRFVDLYVRGAIGEHMAFIFPPLICYFLLKLVSKRSYWNLLGATISIAFLVLSHNALLIMFLPFIIFYGTYLIFTNKKESKRLIVDYLTALVIGFGLSAFFIVPAFLEGKYTLRDIVTGSETLTRFVTLAQVIYSPWNYGQSGTFSVQLGIAEWISFLAFPFVIYKLKKNKDNLYLYIFTLVYLVGSIFIMLPESAFIWKTITTLQKFQFPWRFLSSAVFGVAILGGYLIFVVNKKISGWVLIVLSLIAVLATVTYWVPKAYLYKPETFYTSIYNGTTDTGESAPIWSIRFMEKKADAPAEVIDGAANIKNLSRTSTKHEYEIKAKYRSRIRENTLYFPGWKVYIDGKNYEGIQFQDPNNRGLITYYVLPGKHVVSVVFQNTRIRTISNLVSVLSVILLFVLYFVYNSNIFVKKKK
ncbi:MAG TPA: 6-pyruvoyl-tetrahydropterin synthase-related protein [Patescibacteria group bacterium]|nr:6-pyruvoyl-tetrahydropterin synthase-related protein [Patescibacteria group bacterium]